MTKIGVFVCWQQMALYFLLQNEDLAEHSLCFGSVCYLKFSAFNRTRYSKTVLFLCDMRLVHILRGIGLVEVGQSLAHFVSQV